MDFHIEALVRLAPRGRGDGPVHWRLSLIYAADAISAFEQFQAELNVAA